MKTIEDICFIIYARLGSQRLPGKMLRPFADTTLVDIALEKIKSCKEIPLSNFYLCVHESELIERGQSHGVNVFRRSEASANEDTDVRVLMEWWDKLPYTYCVMAMATLPFLKVGTLDAFIKAYRQSQYPGMFAVVERNNYYWDSRCRLTTPWPRGETMLNTKAVNVTYEAAHSLRAGRLDSIGKGYFEGTYKDTNDPELYVIKDGLEMMDIDEPWQFELCEAYYTNYCVAPARRADPDLYSGARRSGIDDLTRWGS